jgi:lysophospholipase L1-like esterase
MGLLPCLQSHMPPDVVVSYLGTNDAGDRYSLPAETIAGAVGRLVKVARTSEAGPNAGAPGVLVVCPPPRLRRMSV